jgi:hypothetical protein
MAENIQTLTRKCEEWEVKIVNLPKTLANYEDLSGDIRRNIGMANLMMSKKGRFEQFKGLIENCEFGYGEQKTTCMDLQVSVAKPFGVSLKVLTFVFFRDFGS